MGTLISHEIVQTRVWIDPANPNPQLPSFDFKFTYPITIFDAVFSDYGPEPYTLRKAIQTLESLIGERQPMFEADSSNNVVTWTEVRGKVGKLPVTRQFQRNPELRSKDKLVTEATVGEYIDTMTPLKVYDKHVSDVKPDQKSVHISDAERAAWNGKTDKKLFDKHVGDHDVHTSLEEKKRWDAKLDGTEFFQHLKNYSNPHRITTDQINTFNREEILQLIADSQPKFFNYKNIAWDMVNGTFKLEMYSAKNHDPNYILDHRYNQNYWTNPTGTMPDGTEFTIDKDTLRFLPDLVAGQRYFALVAKLPPSVDARYSEVLIYFKDETSPWVEVGTAIANNGDLFITYPDRRLYLWVGGQFVEMMTTSILTGDQNVGTPDHDTKDNLIASQFRISAGTETAIYNGETHTAKVEYENDMITVGRAGVITVYYDGNYSPPIKAGNYKISVTTTGGTAYNPVKVPLEIGTLTITPKVISCDVTVANKVYDSTDIGTYDGVPALVGVVAGDSVMLNPGVAHFVDPNVGHDIQINLPEMTLSGPAAPNYKLVQPGALKASITRKTITITNLSATDRNYDQTTVVRLTGGSLVGVEATDVGQVAMTVPQTGKIHSPDAGSALAVTIEPIILSGTKSSNYQLKQPTTITVNISVVKVKITGLSVANKVYDGTTGCQLLGTPVIDNRIGNDDVTVVIGRAMFVNANVGEKFANFIDFDISGIMAKNYLLVAQPARVTASITPRPVTITGLTAVARPYDATCIVSLTGGTVVDAVDSLTLNLGIGTTLTAKAGFAKAISTAISISGAIASNYALQQPEGITVDITPRTIQITDVRAVDRPYNGTFLVKLTGGALIGVIGADRVTFTLGEGRVDSAEVGNGKPVTTSIKLGSSDADNYHLDQPTNISVNITA